jgi:hypothetical protein
MGRSEAQWPPRTVGQPSIQSSGSIIAGRLTANSSVDDPPRYGSCLSMAWYTTQSCPAKSVKTAL